MSELRRLTVDGREECIRARPDERLIDALRGELLRTGVREACSVGVCGSCTVLVDGRAIASCLALVGTVEGAEVRTIHGLAEGDELHPIQAAFLDHAAFQCSFCTPGFVMATVALLAENPAPTGDEVREGLAGNVCRCGSYSRIEAAVLDAAARLRGDADRPGEAG